MSRGHARASQLTRSRGNIRLVKVDVRSRSKLHYVGDVLLETQIWWSRHTEDPNVITRGGGIGTKLQRWTTTAQWGMSCASPKQLGLVHIKFQAVGRHTVAKVWNAMFESFDGWSHVLTTAVQVQLRVICESMHCYIVLFSFVRQVRSVQDEQLQAHYWALRNRAWDVDCGWHGKIMGNTKWSASQVWSKPWQDNTTQTELKLKPDNRTWSTVSKAAVSSQIK